MTIEINIGRLRYLLSLYRMKDEDLLASINKGLKRLYKREQVFTEQIDLKILKKIDELFGRGIAFYVDPSPIQATDSMSVFFRKKNINDNLNFTSRKVVTEYESMKNYLSSLDVLSGLSSDSDLPHCTTRKSAKVMADAMRIILYPQRRITQAREFLKALINNFAKHNVTVLEYLESANKKEKANIDGFYLAPNFIVLKRQSSYKREIFTLLHELGHFVLQEEEVEQLDVQRLNYDSMSKIERWCNDFAYYFLVGAMDDSFSAIITADAKNDYCHDLIDSISSSCFISHRSLFTRLLYDKKISHADYDNVIADLNERYEASLQHRHMEKNGEDGRKSRPMTPKPIYSESFLQNLSAAYYSGTIRTYDLVRMKIPTNVINEIGSWRWL